VDRIIRVLPKWNWLSSTAKAVFVILPLVLLCSSGAQAVSLEDLYTSHGSITTGGLEFYNFEFVITTGETYNSGGTYGLVDPAMIQVAPDPLNPGGVRFSGQIQQTTLPVLYAQAPSGGTTYVGQILTYEVKVVSPNAYINGLQVWSQSNFMNPAYASFLGGSNTYLYYSPRSPTAFQIIHNDLLGGEVYALSASLQDIWVYFEIGFTLGCNGGTCALNFMNYNEDFYGYVAGGGGGDGIQSLPENTPLPGALVLFTTGLGSLGLLGWRRKRKAQAALGAA